MMQRNRRVGIGLALTIAIGLEVTIRMPFAKADVIAEDTFDSALHRTSFSQDPPLVVVDSTWVRGDWFGVLDPTDPPAPLPDGNNRGVPWSIADNSVNNDPPEPGDEDDQGVVDNYPDSNASTFTSGFKSDKYFGVTDLKNGLNTAGTATATWVFDISGAAQLKAVSIDMGAMGDFESNNDRFDWSYQVDDGRVSPLFTSSVDEDSAASYVLADSHVVNLSDPLLINGQQLSTDHTAASGLPTRTASISGSGSTLTVLFEAKANGDDEAYVFDNIQILGQPGTGALLGDVNLDGAVNGLDVAPFVDHVTNGTYQEEADMNHDSQVNGLDIDPFVALVTAGGVQSVPEPTTLVLLAAGLAGLAIMRRRVGVVAGR